MTKQEIATKLLAGFCANPAVFAGNNYSGWSLVNCDEGQLAEYVLKLAEALLAASTGELHAHQ